mgnify:FL=1
MDNETINKRVHTEIMGKCWHEFAPRKVDDEPLCLHCKKHAYLLNENYLIAGDTVCGKFNPDYCSSLDLAATVEAVVIGKGIDVGYLTDCLADQVSSTRWIPFADAKARMVACLAAWGRGGD